MTDTQVRTPRAEAATSSLHTGAMPRRRWLVLAVAAVIGFLLTVVWSAPFVDSVIGDSVANTLLGHEAKGAEIGGVVAGVAFAFVSGLAGTFTACNIAVFGAMAPMLGQGTTRRERAAAVLAPLGWLAAGTVVVSAVYGAVVGLVGTSMPQFSTDNPATGIPDRLVQSMVVFGVIGLAMLYLGLAALGVVPDPFARISRRFPQAPTFVMGLLIGGFLIGRPFPLFRQMFRDAAESGNPFYGAGAFVLQSVGNIVVLALLFVLLAVVLGGRVQSWLAERPSRLTALTAGGLIAVAVFTVLYWDVRLLYTFGLIPWYPVAPWV